MYRLDALLRLGFPPAPRLMALNLAGTRSSPDRSTKSTRFILTMFRSLWTLGFRFSFTPLPGFFSPFLHSTVRYRSLGSIQPWRVVPPTSRRVSRVPRYSGYCLPPSAFAYRAFTLSGWLSQSHSAGFCAYVWQSVTPACCAHRFGLAPFRSPLLGGSSFLSFPPGT